MWLKQRLDVLLGARPEAEISVKVEREAEVFRTARRERVPAEGGQPIDAAFAFLGEMLPPREETKSSRQVADALRARLTTAWKRTMQAESRSPSPSPTSWR